MKNPTADAHAIPSLLPRLRPLLAVVAVEIALVLVFCLYASGHKVMPGRLVVADVLAVADEPFVVRAQLELEADGTWRPGVDVALTLEGIQSPGGPKPVAGLQKWPGVDGQCLWEGIADPGVHRYRVRLSGRRPELVVMPAELLVGVAQADLPPVMVTGAALVDPGAQDALEQLARTRLLAYVFGGAFGPPRSVTHLPVAPRIHFEPTGLGVSLAALAAPWVAVPPTLICRHRSVAAAAVSAGLVVIRLASGGMVEPVGWDPVPNWQAAAERLE